MSEEVVGCVTKVGKRKRKAWVWIKKGSRSYNTSKRDAVALPKIHDFVRAKDSKIWYAVYRLETTFLSLFPVLSPTTSLAPNEEAPTDDSNADDEENNGIDDAIDEVKPVSFF